MYDAAEQENIKSPKTVRNAYNQRTFFFKQPAPANDNNVQILSVGSLEIVKGHDILLKAMLKLKERFKLTMIGNGPLLEKYMQFVSSNRLGDRVAFLKEIENQYLGGYIRKSHLFCMPSRSEGFGLSALEALACGIPVIGSNVGGLAEMVIDGFNGYLFNPGDADDLARKLSMASEKDWDGEIIAQWAKDHYSVSRWTNEMVSLIRGEIIKNGRN